MMLARLAEIAALFFKLGAIGFGGPAVHIAAMEEETVQRRGWLTRQHFLDLVGATNLIPGPNSTEMAIHIGYVRGGFLGLLTAGAAFILPAVGITTVFAWLYVQYGQQPQVAPVMAGIKPAVLAIIATAGWRLAKKAITSRITATVAIVAAAAALAGFNAVYVLLACGGVGAVLLSLRREKPPPDEPPAASPTGASGAAIVGWGAVSSQAAKPAGLSALAAGAAPIVGASASLWKLAIFFLKVGLVLYGSGYVLFAYVESGLVDEHQWMTRDQLSDAIAVGQLTPGPILSTATFIGYTVMAEEGGHRAGLAGAAVASLCIFLPSFVFVAATNPIVPKLRQSRWAAPFLDAVNAASMGLMAAVSLKLAYDAFIPSASLLAVNLPAVVIAAVALLAALRWKLSPAWLVMGGAVAGGILALAGAG